MKEILTNINLNVVTIFISLLLLNCLSASIGTLKNILVAKQVGLWAVIMVAIDASIYFVVLRSVATSEGISALIAYVTGHALGQMIGNKLENKLAIGIYELKIYIDNEAKLNVINSFCYNNNYSISIVEALSPGMAKRYIILVQCNRKNKKKLIEGIKQLGIEDLTMTIDELKDVSGKILDRQ